MNANRRLEEFILKLNIRRNLAAHCNTLNGIKINSNINDLEMNKPISDNKNCKKSVSDINNK